MSVGDWDLLEDYEADLEHRIEDARGEQLLSLKDPAWKENGGVVELHPRQEIVPPPRQTFVTSASAAYHYTDAELQQLNFFKRSRIHVV